jgi:superfamily I DNA/RNA helicase
VIYIIFEIGPGSGKTRTICGRIAHLLSCGIKGSNILALTFSRKASLEMLDRVAKMAEVDSEVCNVTVKV